MQYAALAPSTAASCYGGPACSGHQSLVPSSYGSRGNREDERGAHSSGVSDRREQEGSDASHRGKGFVRFHSF